MRALPASLRWALGVALLLRLILVGVAITDPSPRPMWRTDDTFSYVEPAWALARHGHFTYQGEPLVFRTPGYSLLMLPGVWLGRPEWFILLLQAALGPLGCWLAYRLADLAFGRPQAGVAAAWLLALEPLSLEYTTMVLTELPGAIAALLVFWLLATYERRGGLKLPVALGLATAAAAFVRPVLLLLVPVVIIAAGGIAARVHRARRAWVALVLVAVTSLGPVGLWTWRNHAVSGYPGFCSIGSIAFYYSNAAWILAAQQGRGLREQRVATGFYDHQIYLRQHPEQAAWRIGERWRYQELEGRRVVRAHLREYLPLHLRGMVRTLLGSPRHGLEWYQDLVGRLAPGARPAEAAPGTRETVALALSTAAVLCNAAILGLAAAALLPAVGRVAWRRRPTAVAMLLSTALLWLASGSVFSMARYRLPFMGVLCLLAALTLTTWLSRRGAVAQEGLTAPGVVDA